MSQPDRLAVRPVPPAPVAVRPVTRPVSARLHLRAATAADHDTVDALFSPLRLEQRDDYGRFLTAQAAAFAAVEGALEAADATETIADWPGRRRLALVAADLAALDLEMPAPIAQLALTGPAAVLGATYVLEGSRLGGTLLKRQVPTAFPTRFLGAADSGLWRGLLAMLDARLTDAAALAAATETAVSVFGLFAASGRRYVDGDARVG